MKTNLAFAFAAFLLIAIPATAEVSGVIVRIDAATGTIVVDNKDSFNAHQLTVTPPRAVAGFRVGETVTIDPQSKSLLAGKSRLTITRAKTLDVRKVRVLSVDRKTGVVKAEFVNGGVTIFDFTPEELQSLAVQPGQTVPLASFATASSGTNKPRCICGQKNDGTCWCVTDITYCCGVKVGPNCRCDRERRKDIYPPWEW